MPSLKIADCSEEIDLYFDLSTTEERENSLHKVQILAEVIQEFKEAIELEIAVINARHVLPQKAMAASTIH